MKTLKTGLLFLTLMSVVLGIIYPLAITGIAQVFFPYRANGSLIVKNGTVVGSELIGQRFMNHRYFQGRPSASNYDGGSSGGVNLGPSSDKWIDLVVTRIVENVHFRVLSSFRPVPSDLVTASASGLDPHISVESAMTQIPRVAFARELDEATVKSLVMKNTERPYFGIRYVNVLKLNMALDNYNEIIQGARP